MPQTVGFLASGDREDGGRFIEPASEKGPLEVPFVCLTQEDRMKITPYERQQRVPTPELRATRHIDDVSDEELETLSYAKIAMLDGVNTHSSTLSGRCRAGQSRREAATQRKAKPGRRRIRS